MLKQQIKSILFLVFACSILKPAFAQTPGFDIPGGIKWVTDQLQNLVDGMIKTFIATNNPTVNRNGLTSAANSTFAGFQNLGNFGYNLSQAITSFANSFYGIHISLWVIIFVSTVVSIIFVIKNGENTVKRTLIVILIMLAIIIVILVFGLQNTILSNLP